MAGHSSPELLQPLQEQDCRSWRKEKPICKRAELENIGPRVKCHLTAVLPIQHQAHIESCCHYTRPRIVENEMIYLHFNLLPAVRHPGCFPSFLPSFLPCSISQLCAKTQPAAAAVPQSASIATLLPSFLPSFLPSETD